MNLWNGAVASRTERDAPVVVLSVPRRVRLLRRLQSSPGGVAQTLSGLGSRAWLSILVHVRDCTRGHLGIDLVQPHSGPGDVSSAKQAVRMWFSGTAPR